jgi:predicted GNAT superfamily acetyltransferase
MEIKTIEHWDYKYVLALNKELLDHYKKKGISAWELTANDLSNSLNVSHSIVAKDQDKVAGYLLTFDFEDNTDCQKPILEYLKDKISEEFLEKINICIGQVCVSKDYRRQGIAEKMYQEFFKKNTSFDLRLMDIDKQYRASFGLHEKLGVVHVKDVLGDQNSSVFAIVLHYNKTVESLISVLQCE